MDSSMAEGILKGPLATRVRFVALSPLALYYAQVTCMPS